VERIIVIVGPTCSGKTTLGIRLAKTLNGEIISADSRQIYKYLDIGTATPTNKELSSVQHHFINQINPDRDYNVSRFEKESLDLIGKLRDRNKCPIIVGGSGLYIKALIDGIVDVVDTDENYREELSKLRKLKGNEFLYEMLKQVDPISAEKMLPQNWKRVIRALEVYHLTGRPIFELHQNHQRGNQYNFIQFGLLWEREILYRNIETRVDKMIEDGLVNEVKEILSKGYSKTINALNTVGYKEIIQFLDNKISIDRAVELIKRNTRRFAKRQMTWFRKDNRINWMNVNNSTNFDTLKDQIITKYLNEN